MSSAQVIEWPCRAVWVWESIMAGAITSSAAASVGRSPGGDSGLILSSAAPALPGRRCSFLRSLSRGLISRYLAVTGRITVSNLYSADGDQSSAGLRAGG